jgi:hypothetical protein
MSGLVPPPPPPGPGVQPPFVAPPTDGARRRRLTAVWLSIGAVVVLIVAGAVGGVGFVVLASRAISDQAEAAVTEYLGALRDEKFDKAYGLLCEPARAAISGDDFAAAQLRASRVTGFQVGRTVLGSDIIVPATVQRANGSVRSVDFAMRQDTRTGRLEVCGEAD